MLRGLLLAASALLFGGPVAAQNRPATEEIGSWVLTCPTDTKSTPCQLRHRTPVLQPGTGAPAASLEVINRGDQFVPVVALRGLSMQAALGGVLALQTNVGLRFDSSTWTDLACSLDGGAVICSPAPNSAVKAAGELSEAHAVTVRVRIALPGVMTLPEQSRSLDLQRTAEALAQFRATAPASESVPVIAGLDWRGFLDQVARDAGFTNGLAGLVPGLGPFVAGRGR